MNPKKEFLVWELPVRIFHWLLAATVFTNFFINDDGNKWHRYTGYVACALIAFRFIWGFFSKNPYSHPRHFFPSIRSVKNFIKLKIKNPSERTIEHNPIAGLVMILMCLLVLILGLSGWMSRLDAFWGEDWVEEWHEITAQILMITVLVHVLSVFVESFLQKENLIASMIHGRKKP